MDEVDASKLAVVDLDLELKADDGKVLTPKVFFRSQPHRFNGICSMLSQYSLSADSVATVW